MNNRVPESQALTHSLPHDPELGADLRKPEGHHHPHEYSVNCHCMACRPLERPCACAGCEELVTSKKKPPTQVAGVQGFVAFEAKPSPLPEQIDWYRQRETKTT